MSQEDFIDYDYEEEIIYDSSPTLDLNRQTSYAIIKKDDLEGVRSNLITQCMEFTDMSETEATLALIYFHWNLEKLRDVWYDDPETYKIKAGIDLAPATFNKLKEDGITGNNEECLICYTEKDDTFKALKCNHFFCGECWEEYVNSRLDDLLTALHTPCPQSGCTLIVPEKFMISSIKSEKRMQFIKALLKNFTDYNKDIKWCPTPDCGICIRCLIHVEKEIECECRAVFCFSCSKEGHRPCPCILIEAWDTKNSSESENVKWLIANTKQCPSCRKYIEKNQGCNHMTCQKGAGGCGYEFCWICLGEWKPHGSSYYQCNKFDAKEDEKKKNETERAKFELERYVFYFDRYINHHKAQKLSEKMRESVRITMNNLNHIKNIPFEELYFLEKAVETIIKCRRILKNTYIFGYYMKEVPEKHLFEHNQNLLEKDADQLHEMMEDGRIEKLIQIDNFEEFNKEFTMFKANIINLSTATTKYQENLLTEIETKMLEFINYKEVNK